MAVGRVIHVDQVLDLHLPVTVIEIAMHSAGDLNLAFGGADGDVVEKITVLSQPLAQAGTAGRQVGKDETVMRIPLRDPAIPSSTLSNSRSG